jgi:hypothetical protein
LASTNPSDFDPFARLTEAQAMPSASAAFKASFWSIDPFASSSLRNSAASLTADPWDGEFSAANATSAVTVTGGAFPTDLRSRDFETIDLGQNAVDPERKPVTHCRDIQFAQKKQTTI